MLHVGKVYALRDINRKHSFELQRKQLFASVENAISITVFDIA